MTELTNILREIEEGDPSASDRLFPLVYEELKTLANARMALERDNHTLQATALVHEAYLRLAGSDSSHRWESRGHYFAAAAEAMRRILINHARDRQRLKRGGGRSTISLDEVASIADAPDNLLIEIDDALDELANEEPEMAELVKYRFFMGYSIPEVADILKLSIRTAERNWSYARAWLAHALRDTDDRIDESL